MNLMLTLLWLTPALLMLAATYLEGRGAGGRWDAFRVAGLGACLVWPLTLSALAMVAAVDRRLHDGRPPMLSSHTDHL